MRADAGPWQGERDEPFADSRDAAVGSVGNCASRAARKPLNAAELAKTVHAKLGDPALPG